MKKIFGVLILLAAVGIPALAQRMSPDDQEKFNSYYSRWVDARQSSDRDEVASMEQRMQDLMAKYGVPSSVPYAEVASQSGVSDRDRDRDDRDRDYRDRDANRSYDNGYPTGARSNMSPEDQRKFDKEYEKWQESTAKNDRDDIREHASKMEEIMARYNIPANTPFDALASNGSYSRQSAGYPQRYERRDDFRGRLSADDQNKFNKEYEEWLKDRRKGESRDDIAKHEGKMQEIMARYNIPQDTPYEVIASGGRY